MNLSQVGQQSLYSCYAVLGSLYDKSKGEVLPFGRGGDGRTQAPGGVSTVVAAGPEKGCWWREACFVYRVAAYD
jgi:hypothetical protein